MNYFLKYHLFPAILAVIIGFFCVVLLIRSDLLLSEALEVKNISGEKTSIRGINEHLMANESQELELVGSLSDKNGLSLFGSSELNVDSPYLPYYFLPDTYGLRTNAFGHAFQQSFSIYCQLLALKNHLKGANVCIILSPGWFETEGTNINAFLEFVRPNFLKRIIHDKSIPLEEKYAIGEFISEHSDAIENLSSSYSYFTNLIQYKNTPFLKDFFVKNTSQIQNVRYHLQKNSNSQMSNVSVNYDSLITLNQDDFIKNSSSNKLFVNDTYFNTYLKSLEKDHKCFAVFNEINLNKNREFSDFKKLLSLLKKEQVKASFIIQGLNPYYFKNLDRFNPTLDKIIALLKQHNYPYLNQFLNSKKGYQPGLLTDVMHTGNVGWLQIDQFLWNTYGKK